MSEENNETQVEELETETSEEPQQERTEEVIPIEWESVRETYEMRQEQLKIEEYLAKFLLNTERQKADLITRLTLLENHVYEAATQLRDELSVDKDAAYELKMPDSPGEKAYFVRKQ
ncbi:MAG: hypothetical protein CBD16_05200 [Betaproteobacteria bacterium TMED156]|nr:MAG: hypothetical protein CBD16_05200 [Betaproteobacteria bacterium TMED156]